MSAILEAVATERESLLIKLSALDDIAAIARGLNGNGAAEAVAPPPEVVAVAPKPKRARVDAGTPAGNLFGEIASHRGWVASARIGNGMSAGARKRAIRTLRESGAIEARGATLTREFRAAK